VESVEKGYLGAIQVGKKCFWVVLCLVDKTVVTSHYFVFISSRLVNCKAFFIVQLFFLPWGEKKGGNVFIGWRGKCGYFL